jgi:hypothetical protein
MSDVFDFVVAHGERAQRVVMATGRLNRRIAKTLAAYDDVVAPARAAGETAGPAVEDAKGGLQAGSSDECPICIEPILPLDDGPAGPRLACGHEFHRECLARWQERSSTCPLCRGPIAVRIGAPQRLLYDDLASRSPFWFNVGSGLSSPAIPAAGGGQSGRHSAAPNSAAAAPTPQSRDDAYRGFIAEVLAWHR